MVIWLEYQKTGDDSNRESLVATKVSVAEESSEESAEVDGATKGIDDGCSCVFLEVEYLS